MIIHEYYGLARRLSIISLNYFEKIHAKKNQDRRTKIHNNTRITRIICCITINKEPNGADQLNVSIPIRELIKSEA